jgi:hypothetical protein
MKALRPFALAGLMAALSILGLRADAPATTPSAAAGWVPPAAPLPNGLLPPDTAVPPGHHRLLERWTAQFGLSLEQELWIEPQLHAEESLTKPVLGYKALTADEQKQILQIIKLAARRQIRTLLTPGQQVKMDAEIDSTKAAGKPATSGT